ncbi:hypothetical protein Ddc_13643 [Ditylenchus destructor]|nr:hypothetical protein Ddc_13643 [Ditylenchus destructor]
MEEASIKKIAKDPNIPIKSKPNFSLEQLLKIMSFLNRDRLEKISISSKLMNNLVQQNFAVKPHRVIQDSWLTVEKQANGRFLKLTRSRKNPDTGETVYERFHITDTSKNLFKWKPYEFSQPQNQWHKGYYSMEDMQPFLPESLRIERIRIVINPMECNG